MPGCTEKVYQAEQKIQQTSVVSTYKIYHILEILEYNKKNIDVKYKCKIK